MMQTKKTNVDFLIPQESKNITSVEMGRGKKNKYQIKHAISRHGCEYGIVVANNTNTIERKKNVIYIPPMTFLFLYEVIMSGLESYYNDYLYML